MQDLVVYATAQLRPGWHDRGFRVEYLNPDAVLIQCSAIGPCIAIAAASPDAVELRLVQGNRAEWNWKDTILTKPEAAKLIAEVFREPKSENLLPPTDNPYLQELAFDLGLQGAVDWDTNLPNGETLRSYALALASAEGGEHPHLHLVHDALEFESELADP